MQDFFFHWLTCLVPDPFCLALEARSCDLCGSLLRRSWVSGMIVCRRSGAGRGFPFSVWSGRLSVCVFVPSLKLPNFETREEILSIIDNIETVFVSWRRIRSVFCFRQAEKKCEWKSKLGGEKQKVWKILSSYNESRFSFLLVLWRHLNWQKIQFS